MAMCIFIYCKVYVGLEPLMSGYRVATYDLGWACQVCDHFAVHHTLHCLILLLALPLSQHSPLGVHSMYEYNLTTHE